MVSDPFESLNNDLRSFLAIEASYKRKKGEEKFRRKIRNIVHTKYEKIIYEYFEGVLIKEVKINKSKQHRKEIKVAEHAKLVNAVTNQMKIHFQDSYAIIAQIEKGIFVENIKDLNCKEIENYIVKELNGRINKNIFNVKKELGCLN